MIIMTNETEKKILNAALNVFAKKGRDAATTKAIAEKAGRTEMTLFRKFGTKKNLFDLVLIQNMEKMKTEMETIVNDLDNKFDNPEMFLETYIRRVVQFYENNIEAITLIVNDDNASIDSLLGDINNFVGEFMAKNLPKNKKINPKTLGIFINSYIYSLTLEVFNGRNVQFDEKIE
ncbi:MAG TPA: TetR/AcrR family transcriptional regulator, partial [Methanobacterium sp.]|nr:TetR/AcrR family transcriptional regulator [Methanobacterium sp.]